MSHTPEFRAYAGWGEFAKVALGYNQTVRVGNFIKVSGQGGWNPAMTRIEDINLALDVDAQTDQAFANVELALKDAGGQGWSQVISIRTLHVGLNAEHSAAVTRNLRQYCPDQPPIWTQYGIAALGHPSMKFEIEVEAYVS